MKSVAFYRQMNQGLGGWFRAHGFRRLRTGLLGWSRQEGPDHLVVWLQVSQDGWDEYAGSKFILEFQLADRPLIGLGSRRARLPKLLADAELKELLARQNRVISKLSAPPPDYWLLQTPTAAEWYRRKFEPEREPYTTTSDVWMRYHDEQDVAMWGDFLLSLLPTVLTRFATGPACAL